MEKASCSWYNKDKENSGTGEGEKMKISETIRERRLAKNYTQEQLANFLGVTAPAVNKWEKGVTYPDITLLPPLARVLDTDLNTLLSFRENLTYEEITLFLNQVAKVIETDGFSAGFDMALSKIKEYPTCDMLVCQLALLLDGAMELDTVDNKDNCQETILALYWQAAKSSDPDARELAVPPLITRLLKEENYSAAQELIEGLREPGKVDKKQLQVKILMAKGKYPEAAKLMEEKLIRESNTIHAVLWTLMEIAEKENRREDAARIAEVDHELAKLLDEWEYSTYLAQFQFHSAHGNKIEQVKLLAAMLKSLTKKWEPNKSPLYRHIKTKEPDKSFAAMAEKGILNTLAKEDPELYRKFSEIDGNPKTTEQG